MKGKYNFSAAFERASPLIIFLFLAVLWFLKVQPLSQPSQTPYAALGLFVIGLCVAMAAAFGAKALIRTEPIPAPAAPPLRDRLALQIVLVGSAAIISVALTLLIALALDAKGAELEKTGYAIFTAVLPIFSTWVGTVLAFYFTNESFRQAAESAQGTTTNSSAESVTRPGTMIPFDRIIRYEMSAAEIRDLNPLKAAEMLPLATFRDLFKPPGVVRIVVFDDTRVPLYVIRHEGLPDRKDNETLKDYLDYGNNQKLARNFSWTGRTATIADARRLLEIRKVTDIFVTDHGRDDEPVIGWVPDDNLQKST